MDFETDNTMKSKVTIWNHIHNEITRTTVYRFLGNSVHSKYRKTGRSDEAD